MKKLRILTWNMHGSYLNYLARTGHEFLVPVNEHRTEGYVGLTRNHLWPVNVREIPASEARRQEFDCILFQSRRNLLEDQFEILSEKQRLLPRIFVEHDPPRESPTDTRHVVDDLGILLVFSTHFDRLMWDAGRTPTRVIEPGVSVPAESEATYRLDRGVLAINHIRKRGRMMGLDLWERARRELPLDLYGTGWEDAHGSGALAHAELPHVMARYRFFFSPIRYTSLSLATLEAMMIGLPVVGLATTELVTVVHDGSTGFIGTDPELLMDRMRLLLREPLLARHLGQNARRYAQERFSIDRFVFEWNRAFAEVTGTRAAPPQQPAEEAA